jgi:hypothetical protein
MGAARWSASTKLCCRLVTGKIFKPPRSQKFGAPSAASGLCASQAESGQALVLKKKTVLHRMSRCAGHSSDAKCNWSLQDRLTITGSHEIKSCSLGQMERALLCK